MKTAVSLPDDLFHDADRLAKRLAVSRSELVARALAQYLAAHRVDDVTARLDRVYAQETSALDPALDELQRRSLPREDW